MKYAHKWLTVMAAAIICGACAGGEQSTTSESATSEAVADSADVAKSATTAAGRQVAKPVYREVTIPAGTSIRLDLASGIASDTSKVEDPVRATVRQAVSVGGSPVIPVGAELAGFVTHAEGSGRVKGRAELAYRFSALTMGDERYDISTETVSHLAEATKGEDAKKIAIGAGAGAAVGALLGGGSGAAKGAAIGGAGGTGVVLATKGKEVRLGPGANVTAKLARPVTVRVKV